ncbi:TonB-dependent receptor [Myxococcota bacterium]|nr:TonB-dependent receptor [Myxococcota bacterium]
MEITRHARGPGLVAGLLLGLALLLCAGAAFAQQAGTLYGVAEDVNGAPVGGIRITVSGPALIGGPRSQLTNAEGQFEFVLVPVGVYQLVAEAQGFQKVVQKNVKLDLGTSVETTFLMETKTAEQVIEVSGKAPVVDKRKTSSGRTLDEQYLSVVPSGRDYQSVVEQTPGVVDGGNPKIHGGSEYSNNYYLDGINVTDPTTNSFGLNFNFEAMNQVQVISGLFSPEYGNVTGGVVNIVTESGSNELTLDTGFYLNHDSLVMEDFEGKSGDFASYEGYFNVGGPIVEDHLWYYLSLQYSYNQSQLTDESPVLELRGSKHPARLYQSFYWLAKLTFAPDEHNRFDFKLQADPATIDNADQDPSAAAVAETHQDQGGLLVGLNYDGLFDDVVIKFSGGYTTSVLDIFPQERAVRSSPFGFPGVFGLGELSKKNSFGRAVGCVRAEDRADGFSNPTCTRDIQANEEFGNGQVYDLDNGGTFGGSASDVYIQRERLYFKPTVSYFLDGAFGNHELKVGSEISIMRDRETTRNPGGVLYMLTGEGSIPDYDGDGLPDVIAWTTSSQDNEQKSENRGRNIAGFVLDNWNIRDRVYMQPGVRIENATYGYDMNDSEYQGREAFDFTVFSPRFGFSIDALGDGRTRVHGGYARMYETGMLQLAKFVSRSLEVRRLRGDANDGQPAGVVANDIRDYNYTEDPDRVRVQGGASGTAIERAGLEPMQSDEWQLGVQQAIGEQSSIDVTYIRRATRNAWEDNERNLIWNQAGTDVIGSIDGSGQQTYVLRTMGAAKRVYDTVEVSLQRQFAERWLFNGSYNLTWYTGTTPELLTRDYDNPRQDIYLDGPLPDEHRHQIKIQMAYAFDMGLTLGFDYLFETGGPYSKFYENLYDGDHTNRRAPRGSDPGDDPNDPSDDKPLRLADYTDLDLRATMNLNQYIGQDLSLVCEIENVLNLSGQTDVQNKVTAENNFGTTTNRQSPFQATLGVTYSY